MKRTFIVLFCVVMLVIPLSGCIDNTPQPPTSPSITQTVPQAVEKPAPEPSPESALDPYPTVPQQQDDPPVSDSDPAVYTGAFAIEGKWKSVGDYGFGQAQPGSIVVFDGKNCNYFSPNDTYAFYEDGNRLILDCTSMLFSQNQSFTVTIIDEDNIEVAQGSFITELKRVG